MLLERYFGAVLNFCLHFDVPSRFCLSNTSFTAIRLRLNRVIPLLTTFSAMTLPTLNVIKGDRILLFVVVLCDNWLKDIFWLTKHDSTMDLGFLLHVLSGLKGGGGGRWLDTYANARSRTLTHSWPYLPGLVKGWILPFNFKPVLCRVKWCYSVSLKSTENGCCVSYFLKYIRNHHYV